MPRVPGFYHLLPLQQALVLSGISVQAAEWHSGYQLWPEPNTEETVVVGSCGGRAWDCRRGSYGAISRRTWHPLADSTICHGLGNVHQTCRILGKNELSLQINLVACSVHLFLFLCLGVPDSSEQSWRRAGHSCQVTPLDWILKTSRCFCHGQSSCNI